VQTRTQIDLPAHVTKPFEVFVNGIPQVEGTDYEVVGTRLVFPRTLVREGPIGFWRWLRMILGIAGTYRRNDTIDIVFARDGRRLVASIAAPPPEPASNGAR